MKFTRHLIQRIRRRLHTSGLLKRRISMLEATMMIVGATIGAGILGVPYAVSQVGIGIGIFYLITIGFLFAGINLMVGEISARTFKNLQLVGLAKRYLGKWGGFAMTSLFYIQLFGILTIYIIGEGEVMANFFAGSAFTWSLVFWGIAALLVYIGLNAVRKAEVILTLAIIATVVVISILSFPHIDISNFGYNNFDKFFLPYGVILFAFSGLGTMPSAYRLLHGDNQMFRQSVIASSSISILIYLIFVATAVGVTGIQTTQLATLGLGNVVGSSMFYFANIFAFLAMMTSFLMVGMQLRDSINWDFDVPYKKASAIALGLPLMLFLFGVREFITAINLVGGIFMSLQVFLILLIYWRAKKSGDIKKPKNYSLHHAFALTGMAAVAFVTGLVYTLYEIIG